MFITGRNSSPSKSNFYSIILPVVTLLAVVFGIYFRFKGLGQSSLAVDEYYIAASVQNILQYGLPQFDCGGYYVRGLILQYLAAPFFAYGANDEFWLRFITVLANILTLPAIYILSKQVSGKTVGYLVVILFSLSIWETEFSRFGRMYAPFQALFIWYLLFLYRRIVLGNLIAIRWMWLFSFLSIFMYEGAIFLVLLNFTPLLIGSRKSSVWEVLVALLIFIIAYTYLTYGFRHLGANSHLPIGIEIIENFSPRLPIELPTVLASSLTLGSVWFAIFVGILTISLFAICYLFIPYKNHTGLKFYHAFLFSLFILLMLLNLFALIIYLIFLTLLTRYLYPKQFFYRPILFSTIVIIITGLFWFCYGISNNEWLILLDSKHSSELKALLAVLLKYPDIITKIIYTWFGPMPIMMSIISPLIMIRAFLAIFKTHKNVQGYLFLFAVVLTLALLMAVLPQPYTSSRYTFHLYPVVLLLVVASIKLLLASITNNATQVRIVLTSCIFLFMLAAEDFGLDHLWNIDSDRILYRIDYNDTVTNHYYQRWDSRSIGDFIRANMKPNDLIASSDRSTPYYLDEIDYFIDRGYNRLCEGSKDQWTNAEVLYQSEKVYPLLEKSHSTTWLVLRSYHWSKPIEKDLIKYYKNFQLFESIDGHIKVFKIPAKTKMNR